MALHDASFNWAYMYGLSDFWSIMMEEPELVNSLLNANTVQMADAYSHFLQLTSTLSLDEVMVATKSQIKLLLVRVQVDPFTDSPYQTYEVKVTEPIQFASTLNDKPILPTLTIESGVDFEFKEDAYGKHRLVFAEDISTYGFPYRQVTGDDGNLYNEYSIWATDVTLDEGLIYNTYGSIIKIDPDISSNIYKDYVRGLYFLFTQGPNIDYLERGLSLSLGVPLARARETVILITQDQEKGNWIIVTDRNSYTLPFGIQPTVIKGQVLSVGESLAKVAEIKDYQTSGDWWLNIYIPKELLPGSIVVPEGGVAVAGSDVDLIMRNYLRTHTFLVRISLEPGSASGRFDNLKSIIDKVKPSYTFAVYAWSIPLATEDIEIDDEGVGDFMYTPGIDLEGFFGARGYIYRNESAGQPRSFPWFIHSNTDTESGVTPADCVQVDPEFDIAVSDYLGTPGLAVNTTYSKLMPLYNAQTSELEAKLTALGISYTPGALPGKFAIKGNYQSNATILTRSMTVAPSNTYDYYSEVSDISSENIMGVSNYGFEPETHRSFYMTPYDNCPYPLDCEPSEVNGRGLVMTNSYQTAAYPIQGALPGPGSYYYSAQPKNITTTNQFMDLSSGKKVVEFLIEFPSMTTVAGYHSLSADIFITDNVDPIYRSFAIGVQAGWLSASNTFYIGVDSYTEYSQTAIYSSGSLVSGTHKVALVFDASAGTFKTFVDDVEVTLLTNTYSAYDKYLAKIQVLESPGLDIADAGKELKISLRTSAGSITTTGLPVGTTTLCGTSLPGSTVGLYDPVTIVATKQADNIDVYSVYALHDYGLSLTAPYEKIEFPVQSDETLQVTKGYFACSYSFDATGAEWAAAPYTRGVLDLVYGHNQKVSYTITGVNSAAGAGPTGLDSTIRKVDLSTGNKSIEITYAGPFLTGSGAGAPVATMSVVLANTVLGLSATKFLRVQTQCYDDGSHDLLVSTDLVTLHTDLASTAPLYSLAFVFNAGAGTVRMWKNGAEVVLGANTYTPSNDYLLTVGVDEYGGADPSVNGQILMTHIRTASTGIDRILTKLPAGSDDLCGITLP